MKIGKSLSTRIQVSWYRQQYISRFKIAEFIFLYLIHTFTKLFFLYISSPLYVKFQYEYVVSLVLDFPSKRWVTTVLFLKLYFYTWQGGLHIEKRTCCSDNSKCVTWASRNERHLPSRVVGSDISDYWTEMCGQPLEITVSCYVSKGW